jgi:hypothetical protein
MASRRAHDSIVALVLDDSLEDFYESNRVTESRCVLLVNIFAQETLIFAKEMTDALPS